MTTALLVRFTARIVGGQVIAADIEADMPERINPKVDYALRALRRALARARRATGGRR